MKCTPIVAMLNAISTLFQYNTMWIPGIIMVVSLSLVIGEAIWYYRKIKKGKVF